MENTNQIDILKELSNSASSEDRAYTRSPIFVVQDLKYVARVDEDIYEESSSLEGGEVYRYEYFTDENSRTAKQAIQDIEEAIEEDEEELRQYVGDAVESYKDYKTDRYDLKNLWDVFSEYGSGLCKYMYIDQTWFLTRKEAEKHIERRKHSYNNPRIYVKSLIYTDFEVLFKELGFKHYN